MAKQLRSVHSVWAALDHLSLEKTVTSQVTHRPQFTKGPKALDKHAEFRNILLSNTVQSVVPLDVFNRSLPKYSGLPKADSDQWRKDVEPLLQIYEQVTKVLETRTAHTSAYEASFSMLYEAELRSALMGPNPPQYPERYALRISKLKVGMTPPRADTRFAVEGIWLTIDVRFALGTLAERVFSHLASQPERNQAQIDAWGHFTAFIYNTCSRDAGIAFKLASSTQAHRQQLLTSMRIIKSAWRATQFLVISRQSQGMASDIEEREILTREVEDRLSLQRKNAEAIRETYIRQGGLSREVVERDFDVPVRECFKYWEDLVTTLKRPAVFYSAVSEKELQEVVGSFKEFSHRGHWYTCPNGHIFTIGECGGAMQISRCHECGSTIGGSNHQTVDGVQQAANLERIAATQGAAASPWRWNNNV
ncbi:hypothetical protein FRC19_000650 [Serendipita sp. 401]|nr:hypothetical protein FRC15_002418 [Serendipita sp. 397]KAG8815977.1 hypothetical protein FRC19_000650 [Serendipita sp. 401]KAG9050615.1 hypothetical protein FS842_011339 [Serendipita sp. 407]